MAAKNKCHIMVCTVVFVVIHVVVVRRYFVLELEYKFVYFHIILLGQENAFPDVWTIHVSEWIFAIVP